MKKLFCLFTIGVSFICAEDIAEPSEGVHPHANITYFKMGGSLIPGAGINRVAPAFALGERFERGVHGIDLSMGGGCFNKNSYFVFPKVMYLRYFDSTSSSSLYAGGGLSYGNIKNKVGHKKFEGILAEAAVGYEWMRNTSIRTFVELNATQSAIALSDQYQYMPPVLSVSFGIGF